MANDFPSFRDYFSEDSRFDECPLRDRTFSDDHRKWEFYARTKQQRIKGEEVAIKKPNGFGALINQVTKKEAVMVRKKNLESYFFLVKRNCEKNKCWFTSLLCTALEKDFLITTFLFFFGASLSNC